MELSDVLSSIRRRKHLVIALILLTAAVAAVYYGSRGAVAPAPRFRSGVQLLIPARTKEGAAPEGIPPVLLQGQEELAQLSSTTGAVSKAANLPPTTAASLKFNATLSSD